MSPGEDQEEYTVRRFEEMKVLLREQHATICAVIVEPLVQCAGYMRMYQAQYWRVLDWLCLLEACRNMCYGMSNFPYIQLLASPV